MEVTFNAPDLKRLLTVAYAMTGGPTTFPLTKYIMLDIHYPGNHAFLTCSNLEMQMVARIPVKTNMGGRFLLRIRPLARFIAPLKHDVHIDFNDKDAARIWVKDTQGMRAYSEITASVKDGEPLFRSLEMKDTCEPFSLSAADIAPTIPYAASDISRPVLQGLVFRHTANALEIVAADGFTLNYTHWPGTGSLNTLIPARACALVCRALPGTFTLAHNATKAVFTGQDMQIYVQTIQGNFPQYMQLIPQQGWRVTTSGMMLAGALAQMDEMGDTGVCRLTFSDGDMHVTRGQLENEYEGLRYEFELPANYTPDLDEHKTALDYRFLTRVAHQYNDLAIELNSPSSPIKFYDAMNPQQGCSVIMPMFVQW